jgi:PAS domain S-box-containing protein
MERRLVESVEPKPRTRYALAVACAVCGLLIRLPLNHVLEARVPYITFFLATAVSASYGGLGPGIVTSILGALLAVLYIVPLSGRMISRDPGDFLGLMIFLAGSSFISYLAGKRIDAAHHENALRILFQQTFQSIGDAIIAMDIDKRVRLMNPVAEELTGWTEAEAQGQPIGEVFRIFKENSRIPEDLQIDRILKTGQAVALGNFTELENRHGKRIPIDDSGAPIRATNGRIAGAVLIFRDISDRRKNEKQLQAVNEELKQFTYAASHDIREPLRSISIFAQFAKKKLHEGKYDESESHLTRVSESAQALAHLIESLLQFTRIRDGDPQTESTAGIDANGALVEAKRNLEVAIAETGASIDHEPLPSVRCNFVHLCQVFQNLVGNAIKYRRSGVPVTIAISSKREGNHHIFAVKDNGIGIPPEHLNAIFEPFKRFHGGEQGGAGIGLAVCKRIVERYDGRIWAVPNDGPGTTFFFSLPAGDRQA